MNSDFAAEMSLALGQTRAGALSDATRTIREALAGQKDRPDAPARSHAARSPRRDMSGIEDAEIVEDHPLAAEASRQPREGERAGVASGAKRLRLRDTVDLLRRGRRVSPLQAPRSDARAEVPEGARWEARSVSTPHGGRDYRLYVPASLPNGARGWC